MSKLSSLGNVDREGRDDTQPLEKVYSMNAQLQLIADSKRTILLTGGACSGPSRLRGGHCPSWRNYRKIEFCVEIFYTHKNDIIAKYIFCHVLFSLYI